MKTMPLVVGIVLVVIGGLFLAGAVGAPRMPGHVCATNLVAANLFGVPQCGSNIQGFSGLAMFGIILVALAGIIIFDGRTRPTSMMVTVPITESVPMNSALQRQGVPRFCSTCGNPINSESRFCPKCGSKL